MIGRFVGFDLDLTLIDSRPGIGAVYQELARRTGVAIDVSSIRIGPPLESELARFFPAAEVPAMADLYRELYPAYAIESSPPAPGALDAVAAVRDAGGRVVVISSKYAPNVEAHLVHCGFTVDAVVGWAYADGKRDALRKYDALAYVGDYEADMQAAAAAGVTAVGVATGPTTTTELTAAGADVVLPDLTGFRAWLAGHLASIESRLGVPPSSR